MRIPAIFQIKKILPLLCLTVVCIVTGCGYTTSSALPPRLKTIYIQPFKNSISYTKTGERNVYFPLLEVKAHNKVVDRFLFDGNLKVVESENADLILKGDLVEYRRSALRYTDNDVEEYRVQIITKLELYDVDKQEPMWKQDNFVGEADYFISGAQATTEDSAVEDAVTDLARRIVERTIENW